MMLNTAITTKEFFAVAIVTTDCRGKSLTLATMTAVFTSPLPIETFVKVFIAEGNESLDWGILRVSTVINCLRHNSAKENSYRILIPFGTFANLDVHTRNNISVSGINRNMLVVESVGNAFVAPFVGCVRGSARLDRRNIDEIRCRANASPISTDPYVAVNSRRCIVVV